MKLKTLTAIMVIGAFTLSLSGCAQFGKRNVGIAAGGATGALVGDALFDGSGLGIAAGAVGGALAGNAIAKDSK
jgi:osmotically inducible lipoprotein OsmB